MVNYNLFLNTITLKSKSIRKPNLYLGFTPAKRADPIRLVMNLRVPYRLTQRLVQPVKRLHHRVANRRLSRLYEANMGAEGVVFVVSRRQC